MGRSPNSPNIEYRWCLEMHDPVTDVVIFSKKYTTIGTMYKDTKPNFTVSQLHSYASHTRKSPNYIHVLRITNED